MASAGLHTVAETKTTKEPDLEHAQGHTPDEHVQTRVHRPSSSAALLAVPMVSKPVKTGRQRGLSLIRSSLPNMPLRDIVTPQRPLPHSLILGPQKMRKSRNAKPPQPSKSESNEQLSVNDADNSKHTAHRPGTSVNSKSQLSTIESPETKASSLDVPADSTASSLHDAATPNMSTTLQLHDISSSGTEAVFHTAGSLFAPDSPGLSTASEKAKLWELVEQLERQLRYIRNDSVLFMLDCQSQLFTSILTLVSPLGKVNLCHKANHNGTFALQEGTVHSPNILPSSSDAINANQLHLPQHDMF